LPRSWPAPTRRPIEGIPIISSDLVPAVRRGDVVIKPGLERLRGGRASFVDGTEESIDRVIYATGYSISLPFMDPSLTPSVGREFPLYRRIVPPGLGGLFFAGFVDAPGGLLPVVEMQGEWIAAALRGSLRFPSAERMWPAIDRAERRTRERFPEESARSIRCDPHAYCRLLHQDLRRAKWHRLRSTVEEPARAVRDESARAR
jgi:Flavin-binding monooxygenase-like